MHVCMSRVHVHVKVVTGSIFLLGLGNPEISYTFAVFPPVPDHIMKCDMNDFTMYYTIIIIIINNLLHYKLL